MKYDDEYYDLILDYDTSSSISWDENTYRVANFDKYQPIIVDKMIYMKIDDDEEPLLGDFLSEPFNVWSKKAKEIIEKHVPFGSQFFPVTIKHRDKEYSDYFILNCHNEIKSMHEGRSKFTMSRSGLSYFIDRLSLDEAVLDKIPEEQRMIFVMEEKAAMVLYHEKLVKALEDANVTGVSFVKVNDWSIGSSFD
jgi:hypothetical protein